MAQPVPPDTSKPSFLQMGLSCRFVKLCRSSGPPAIVLKTRAFGSAPARMRAARISTAIAANGTERSLRSVFGTSK
jgi:hypothetical protein